VFNGFEKSLIHNPPIFGKKYGQGFQIYPYLNKFRLYSVHCDESERAVPGPSPDVSDQTFPGPEYDLLLWAE